MQSAFAAFFEKTAAHAHGRCYLGKPTRMKQIKLTGRERSVLRVLDFSNGNTGAELLESARLEADDLVGVLNSLMGPGYLEMVPYAEEATLETFDTARFDVNPSYAHELRTAMAWR